MKFGQRKLLPKFPQTSCFSSLDWWKIFIFLNPEMYNKSRKGARGISRWRGDKNKVRAGRFIALLAHWRTPERRADEETRRGRAMFISQRVIASYSPRALCICSGRVARGTFPLSFLPRFGGNFFLFRTRGFPWLGCIGNWSCDICVTVSLRLDGGLDVECFFLNVLVYWLVIQKHG